MPSNKAKARIAAILNAQSVPGLNSSTLAQLQDRLADEIDIENQAASDIAKDHRTTGEDNATGTITLNGSVVAVNVTNSGDDYTSIPDVTFASGTATATAKLKIVTAQIDTAGTGYSVNQLLTVAGGTGTSAILKVTSVGLKGEITGLTIVHGGSYSVLPDLTANPVIDTGTFSSGAAVDLTAGLESVTVTGGGSSYTSAPGVTIANGGGTGATATSTIRGPIASVAVANAGSNYDDTPGAAIARVNTSTGSGADISVSLALGEVSGFVVNSGGTNYSLTDTITVIGGNINRDIAKRLQDF